MQDPSKSVQDHTLFSYDDVFFVPPTAPGGHIRAMREGDWTYAVYFSMDGSGWESEKPPGKPDTVKQSLPQPAQLEYELYNIQSDSGQMSNLLHGKPTEDVRKEWRACTRSSPRVSSMRAIYPMAFSGRSDAMYLTSTPAVR